MTTLPLHLQRGHVFVELAGELWLLDTGAPTSFGTTSSLTIAAEQFSIGESYLDLTTTRLQQFVGVPCVGLLGADVLGRFDHVFDIPDGRLTISANELGHIGNSIHLDNFKGIPIATAQVGGGDYRMFVDTGAQLSYLHDTALRHFPPVGMTTDFYPSVGEFQTETYEVPVSLGGLMLTLRCGVLPRTLATTLMVGNTQGIIGNAIFADRTVGYFPRRGMMVL